MAPRRKAAAQSVSAFPLTFGAFSTQILKLQPEKVKAKLIEEGKVKKTPKPRRTSEAAKVEVRTYSLWI